MLANVPRVFNALVQFVNEWVRRWTRYEAHVSGVWVNFFRYPATYYQLLEIAGELLTRARPLRDSAT
jgi:hypothetical protein